MPDPVATTWPTSAGHRTWLRRSLDRLLDAFDPAADDDVRSTGFTSLDTDLSPLPDRTRGLVDQCRLTYCHALAHLSGRPGALATASNGTAFLLDRMRDADGGFVGAVELAAHGTGPDGGRVIDPVRRGYGHAFVVLAGAAAAAAGVDRGTELLDAGTQLWRQHFFDDSTGVLVEDLAEGWRDAEDYRGQNSHMHACEALLAAADVTGDDEWRRRAGRVAAFVIAERAAGNGWRVQEHFDAQWRPQPDYNVDKPFDIFRPPGTTPGHSFEWARLLVQVERSAGDAWCLDAAVALYEQAVTDMWHGRPDAPGAPQRRHPVYNVDADDRPIVDQPVWWTVAEALGAAAALAARTGDPRFAADYARWWGYAERWFADREHGGWFPTLTADGRPSEFPFRGKPDLYHLHQLHLYALVPEATSAIVAARDAYRD